MLPLPPLHVMSMNFSTTQVERRPDRILEPRTTGQYQTADPTHCYLHVPHPLSYGLWISTGQAVDMIGCILGPALFGQSLQALGRETVNPWEYW